MLKNRKAASPAISMVIITTTTIVLVLVASIYAYQVLERQRGASEFEAVKKSFTTLDDAIRDVALDRHGIRSARFTVQYGFLEVMPNNTAKGLPLNVYIEEYPQANYSTYTGYIRYNISTNYVTYGYGYRSYFFGDEKPVVSKSTESYGAALIEQRSGWVSLTLYYRVRAVRNSVVKVNNVDVNYVDILIIKITASKWSTYISDFDLVAENKAISTTPYGPYNVNSSLNKCNVKVSLGEFDSSIALSLVPGEVVFNFIVAEVMVST